MSFKILILSAFFYLFFWIIAFSVSGFLPRKHKVLPPEQTISLSSHRPTVGLLASAYCPRLFASNNSTPPPSEILYEVLEKKTAYHLIYRFVWAHKPDFTSLSGFFCTLTNFIYYGYSGKDIAYTALTIDKKTADITHFEFAPAQNCIHIFKNHNQVQPIKTNRPAPLQDKKNTKQYLNISNTLAPTLLLNSPKNISAFSPNASSNKLLLPTPTFLNEKNYKTLKIARRNQGNFTPKEAAMNTPIIFFVGLIATVYFYLILKANRRKKIPS